MSEQAPITVSSGGITVELDEPTVRQIVRDVVHEVLESSDHGGRLAYTETEAASLIGVPRHRLRDARLRGEITAGRVGKAYLYSRRLLLEFVERNGDES